MDDVSPESQNIEKPNRRGKNPKSLGSRREDQLGGRPKGSKNKGTYSEIRKDMIKVYSKLGGWKGVLQFAQSHKDCQEMFYKEFFRTVPKEPDDNNGQGHVKLVVHMDGKEFKSDAEED